MLQVAQEAINIVGQVACNPCHEAAVRVGRDANDLDCAGRVVDDEQQYWVTSPRFVYTSTVKKSAAAMTSA